MNSRVAFEVCNVEESETATLVKLNSMYQIVKLININQYEKNEIDNKVNNNENILFFFNVKSSTNQISQVNFLP